MLPVADGSDYGGSLRNPAACNNVFGFRTVVWPRARAQGSDVFMRSMGVPGPMARTVPDLAMLLSVQAGYDPRAAVVEPPGPATCSPNRSSATSRAPASPGSAISGAICRSSPGVLDLCKQALKGFERLGCTVEEAVPDYPMERIWENLA